MLTVPFQMCFLIEALAAYLARKLFLAGMHVHMSIEMTGTAEHFETNVTFVGIFLLCPNNLSKEKLTTTFNLYAIRLQKLRIKAAAEQILKQAIQGPCLAKSRAAKTRLLEMKADGLGLTFNHGSSNSSSGKSTLINFFVFFRCTFWQCVFKCAF